MPLAALSLCKCFSLPLHYIGIALAMTLSFDSCKTSCCKKASDQALLSLPCTSFRLSFRAASWKLCVCVCESQSPFNISKFAAVREEARRKKSNASNSGEAADSNEHSKNSSCLSMDSAPRPTVSLNTNGLNANCSLSVCAEAINRPVICRVTTGRLRIKCSTQMNCLTSHTFSERLRLGVHIRETCREGE